MLPLAYCGNDCNACPRYAATLSGDEQRLKAVANLWKRLGLRDVTSTPREVVCQGCRAAKHCVFMVKECALGKGVENCGRCEAYPCERLTAVFNFTALLAERCQGKCPPAKYRRLRKAFFSKKTNLDRANREYLSERRDGASS
jgi:hypothetical protein